MRFKHIHIIAALFLIVGMCIQCVVAYQRAAERVQERMGLEMQVAQEKLLFELYDAYDVEHQLKEFMRDEMTDPTELLDKTYSMLKLHPQFFTCYIAYPPYAFPGKKWYALNSYRSGDTIISATFGDPKHDYFQREWWLGAQESGRNGYWSQPYHDEAYTEPIFTYSNDFRDKEGNLICVFGIDFSVSWLQRTLEKYKPFDDVVFALYSSNGTLLAASIPTNSDLSLLTGNHAVRSLQSIRPININMMMAVPRTYIWKSIQVGILGPLAVFVLGIVIVGLLLRRMARDEKENARLELQQGVMAKELQIAHNIQMGILKEGEVRDECLELNATLIPMREVGGDLYDFHREGDTLWFIIGDVSGKGIPAAMFMSATVNLFRAIGRQSHSPGQMMEEMNVVLSENNPSLTFVTAFIGRLHIPSGELLYCNAGHLPPIIYSPVTGNPSPLTPNPNIPLGYDGRYSFVEQGCMLGEGERLVLYTDGVTEARNRQREMLGQGRLSELVKSGRDLLAAVKQYMGEAEPVDDITLLTIRKRSEVQPKTLRVANRDDQWPVLKRAIHEYGVSVGMERRALQKLEVATEEAVVNILHYSGAAEIEMALSRQDSAFCIRLTDDGRAFDPTAHQTKAKPEEKQIGGLGISLIRQLVDEIHYERKEEKNILGLVKKINP